MEFIELIKIIKLPQCIFGIGYVLGFLTASWVVLKWRRRKEPIEKKEMNDENVFYVKLPQEKEATSICIEEPLGLDHKLVLDNVLYVVDTIHHNVEGHTIFNLRNA